MRRKLLSGAKDGSKWLKEAKSGNAQALAKLLTWLENSEPSDIFALEEILNPPQLAYRFGITGPPGAGKSTLVGRLIGLFRAQNLKVGVLAVDPSSPFSKGAILGDRIRYSEHFLDPQVFIRSLATRGSLGGLSSGAYVMARAFDVCAYDVLLIETVGVGQSELDVLHVADDVGVVLVPESGDSVQAMKAGLMEIADVFVVNKGDRPGADGLLREIHASLQDGESEKAPAVIKCVATENRGVQEFGDLILKMKSDPQWKARRSTPERLKEEARALLRKKAEASLGKELSKVKDLQSFKNLF